MRYGKLFCLQCSLGLYLFGGLGANAVSGAFSVSPLNFHLTQDRTHSTLRVRNTDLTPLRLQITSFDWEHDGTQEVLTETNKLLVNPPIFVLEPDRTQVIRLGIRAAKDWENEKAYRLVLDEVLPETQLPGLRTRLRISIPVFVEPIKPYKQIEWSLQQTPSVWPTSMPLKLVASNTGNVHIKITTLIVNELENRKQADQKGKGATQLQTPVYVLPGQRKEWILENIYCPCSADTARIQLQVQTPSGSWVHHLAVVPSKENDFYHLDQWKLLSSLPLPFE